LDIDRNDNPTSLVTPVLEEVEKQLVVEKNMRNIVERFKLVFRGNRYQQQMIKPDVTCPVDRFGSD